jgi:anti-sigma28 factor (negative regulator of flagellin synthesis)
MRIDANRPAADTGAVRQEGARRAPRDAGSIVSADRVDVSASAKVQGIVAEAVSRATAAPDVRPEAVERARRLLAEGNLGRDSVALASAMLDDLLDRP